MAGDKKTLLPLLGLAVLAGAAFLLLTRKSTPASTGGDNLAGGADSSSYYNSDTPPLGATLETAAETAAAGLEAMAEYASGLSNFA